MKIHRKSDVLPHNIRIVGDIKCFFGRSVDYKHRNSKGLHGPAKVLGRDGLKVLVKNGITYIRVHSCRLHLIQNSSRYDQISAVQLDNFNICQKPLSILNPHNSRPPSPDIETKYNEDDQVATTQKSTINSYERLCPSDQE